jgi:nitroreductase
MEIPVESWYRAIFVRRSRRSFIDRLPEEEKVAMIEKVCREFRLEGALKEGAEVRAEARVRVKVRVRAEFVRLSPEKVFRGIVGNYGRITGAPYYVALIGETGAPNVEESVGYLGEGVILEATALGLGTCWVSGFFRPEPVRDHIAIAEDERVYAVTPIGYTSSDYSAKEKLYASAARSRKRKSFGEIVEGGAPEPWQEKATEAARMAPSAANRQPWRFVLGEKSITVRVDNPKDSNRFPKRLDCGIAMLHIELGAMTAGKKGQWEPLLTPEVAQYELI